MISQNSVQKKSSNTLAGILTGIPIELIYEFI